MPIDTNGSSLRVVTNFGGEFVDNEDRVYQDALYGRNQQRGEKETALKPLPLAKMPAPPPPKIKKIRSDKTKADKALDEANSKDLRNRNITNQPQTDSQ